MSRRLWMAVVLLVVLAGCRPPQDPIRLVNGTLVVENQSTREWRSVVVTVNDHFRGGVSTLAPSGRMTASLGQFTTGFGQRFDPSRQSVTKVIVTATDNEGEPVELRWER